MKSLVTGGLGFIGTRMCQRLLDEGHEVVVLDIGLGGARRKINHPKIKYVLNDVCNYKDTRWLYDDVDYVFHMAAVSRVPACEENPTIAFNTNYIGTATVLQCALEAGVKHVVNSSTSAVYGNNAAAGATEYDTNPISHYGHSKYHAELLCNHYNQHHKLRTTSLRYFNVYGPGEDASGQYAQVVAIFMDNYRKGQPFKIFGDGTQMRDFVHVDDVVNINFKCITHNDDIFYGGNPYGRTFNVGTGVSRSILSIAKAIQPNETNVIFANYRQGDVHKTLANTNNLENTFNIKPKDRVLDYIKEQLNEV